MKKTILLSMVVMLGLAAMAQPQQPTLRSGQWNKGVDHLMAYNSRIAAVGDNEVLMATWSTRSFLGVQMVKGLQVVAVDTNMQVLRQVELPEGKACQLVFCTYVEDSVYVLYRHEYEARYYRAVVEPKSMTVVRCDSISTGLSGKNLEAYRWTAKSDNGLFYAVASVFGNTVMKEALSRQLLLDEKLQVLWEKRYESRLVSDMTVDDEGVVRLFGYRYDKSRGEITVEVATLDVDSEQKASGTARVGEVHRMCLLNMAGPVAVAAGYLRSPQSDKNSDEFDQMIGLAFDTRTREVRTESVRFTSDDWNVFMNKPTKNTKTKEKIDALVLAGRTATDYGGALLLQRCWKITTHSTKNPDVHDYYTWGSLVLAVDTTGHILWHKPLRTVYRETTGQASDIPTYTDAVLMAEGDNVYAMLPESAKTPTTYDISRPADQIRADMVNHALSVYGFDKEGRVSKQVWLQKEKGSVMDNLVPVAPKQYVTVQSFRNKSALVYVNF